MWFGHGSTALILHCEMQRPASRSKCLKTILIGRLPRRGKNANIGQWWFDMWNEGGGELIWIFSDHDELRYSIRSVLANFRQATGQFHLLTTDFVPSAVMKHSIAAIPHDWRLGQIPHWLDAERKPWTDDSVTLTTKHHTEFFQSYKDNIFNRYVYTVVQMSLLYGIIII